LHGNPCCYGMASSGTIRIVKQIRREGRNEMEIKEEVVRVLVTRTAVVAIDYLLHMTLRLIENATITIAWEPRPLLLLRRRLTQFVEK